MFLLLLGVLFGGLAHASPSATLERIEALDAWRDLRKAEGPPPIPREEYQQAIGGEIVTGLQTVEGHRARKAYGVAIVDVPIGQLWAAINDELSHDDYTQVSYTELLQGQRCESGRAVLMYLPVPLVSNRWWITHLSINRPLVTQSSGQARELYWRSTVDPAKITSEEGQETIRGGIPIAFTKGGWFLGRIDDRRTLLEYYVWTDPGGRIPAGPASRFAAGSIVETIEAMKTFAREGQIHCPVP